METPSQALICCNVCGEKARSHRAYKTRCDPCARSLQVEYQRKHREKKKLMAEPRTCKVCGEAFDTSQTQGRVTRCPSCEAAYRRAYAAKDKAKHAEYSRAYRERRGDEYRTYSVERRKVKIAEMSPDELEAFRKAEADKSRRIFSDLKEQVFDAYGGYRCNCCGETEPLFLTIDHVENDGAEMRRNGTHGRSGTAFYQWLRKSGFPSGFQVLCMNCNIGKHRNGGVCPHRSEKA